LFLGGIGHACAALLILYANSAGNQPADFWQRLTQFKRIPLKWYVLIPLTLPVVYAVAIVLDNFFSKHYWQINSKST